MTRDELQATLNISQDFILAGRKNRPGTRIEPTFLTIHNTDNTSKGADATAHASFVKNTGHYVLKSGKKNWVSWHFTVDDRRIVQHLPLDELGYHAGAGNTKSVAIEICMNSGIDQQAAFDRAAGLAALLIYDTDHADPDFDRIVPHFRWTKKNCPSLLLNDAKPGSKWTAFVERVKAAYALIE